LEQERNKFDNNEKKNAYYNTKDKILDFFKADVETQRNEIRQIVDECFIYNNYLLIAANKRLFLFNISEKNDFDDWVMRAFTHDGYFMENFIKDEKNTFTNRMLGLDVLPDNSVFVKLDEDDNRAKIQKGFSNHSITYDLKDTECFIAFDDGFIVKPSEG
jgi:secreted Zn-dependent insulinase-like peptidase